jgi:hypothetical protein
LRAEYARFSEPKAPPAIQWTGGGEKGSDYSGEHFMECPGCREWFDMRDLGQVLAHVHEAEIQIVERDPAPGALTLLDITDALIAEKPLRRP